MPTTPSPKPKSTKSTKSTKSPKSTKSTKSSPRTTPPRKRSWHKWHMCWGSPKPSPSFKPLLKTSPKAKATKSAMRKHATAYLKASTEARKAAKACTGGGAEVSPDATAITTPPPGSTAPINQSVLTPTLTQTVNLFEHLRKIRSIDATQLDQVTATLYPYAYEIEARMARPPTPIERVLASPRQGAYAYPANPFEGKLHLPGSSTLPLRPLDLAPAPESDNHLHDSGSTGAASSSASPDLPNPTPAAPAAPSDIHRPRPAWTQPGGPIPAFIHTVPDDFEEHRWNMAYVVHAVGGLSWHPECGCYKCDTGARRAISKTPQFYPGREPSRPWVDL